MKRSLGASGMILSYTAAVLFCLSFFSTAQATIMNVTNNSGVDITDSSVITGLNSSLNASENKTNAIVGFEEVQNYLVEAGTTLGDITFSENTYITSYLIYLYPENTSVTSKKATFTFDSEILTVIKKKNALLNSNKILGLKYTASGTWWYAAAGTDSVTSQSSDALSLTVTMDTEGSSYPNDFVDVIRVITVASASSSAVPEPATMMLLGFGMLCFSGVARRKK